MWKKLLLMALFGFGVLVIQACGQEIAPEAPCNFVQNSAQQRVSWEDRLPIKLFVHTSVKEKYHAALQRAIESWNETLKQEAFKVEIWGVGGPLDPRKDGYNTIYIMDSWDDGPSQEQARTTIHWSGRQIVEADIRFNDADFDFYVGQGLTGFAGVDFQSLAVHELGHALGLAHRPENESVMHKNLSSGTSLSLSKSDRREPQRLDRNSLQCEYKVGS